MAIRIKPTYRKAIAIVLSILVALLVGMIILVTKKQDFSNNTSPRMSNISHESEASDAKIELVYRKNDGPRVLDSMGNSKNDGLWVLDSMGNSKQITDSGQSVCSYSVSANNSLIAYVTGEEIMDENYDSHFLPGSVYVYSYDKDETQKIYDLKPEFNYSIPKSYSGFYKRYAFGIEDVGVSQDGTKVAIITTNSLLLYDVPSSNLKEVYRFPLPFSKDFRGWEILSYYAPVFSPDNSKILFSKGLWEGWSYGFVDLSSNSARDLPYSGATDFASGEKVLGWFDNSRLLINEYTRGNELHGQSIHSSYDSRIFTAELTNPKNRFILADFRGEVISAACLNNKIYAIECLYKKVNAGMYYGSASHYFEPHYSIYELDLNTMVKKKLNTIESGVIVEDVVSMSYRELRVIPGGRKLYVGGSVRMINPPIDADRDTQIVMVMDFQEGLEPRELIQNARF